MNLKNTNPPYKSLFLHGRPRGNARNWRMAESIGAETIFIDHYTRWQDVSLPAHKRYWAWMQNAIHIPNRNQYDLIFSAGLHYTFGFLKWLGLLKKNQKTGAIMADESLYFLHIGWYSKVSGYFYKKVLNSYDVLFCKGEMQTWLAKQLREKNGPEIVTVSNGIAQERYDDLLKINYNPASSQILFIGNGPSGWRTWYKGMDLMIPAFAQSFEKNKNLTFLIVGEWTPETIQDLTKDLSEECKRAVHFHGKTDNIHELIAASGLYLHCSRGEGWGMTIIEAMAAGVPAIISEWTGCKEVIEQVDKRFILPLDTQKIIESIDWFFALTDAERLALSVKSKEQAVLYSEERSLKIFQEQVFAYLNRANGKG